MEKYEGCCRAALNSDGHAHDHQEWYAMWCEAEAVVAVARHLLKNYPDPSKMEPGDAHRAMVAISDVLKGLDAARSLPSVGG